MNPHRLATLAAAALIASAPALVRAAAPLPDPWAQSAQEQEKAAAKAAEAARTAGDAARASAQAVKETQKQIVRDVERQVSDVERHQAHAGEGRGETFGDKLGKVVKVTDNPTVLVHSFSGNITVSSGAAGEVRVEATKRVPGHGGADAKSGAENARVSVEERAGRVEVRAWTPRGPTRVAVDFDVVVPSSAVIELKSLSGDISVTGVKGGVTAESMSGNIMATSLASGSTLKTVSGNVLVNASTVSGDLSANSVSGNVTAKGLKVRSLSAGTVSGNVAVQNASCDRATVRSVSGNVEIGGAMPKSARYELKSHSGDVRVIVDGKTGFEVDLSTWSGSIVNDLGIKNAAPPQDPDVPGPRHKTLQGIFGDGSAQIEATSFSGTVSVVKAK
jgi:hypothetical protein